MNTESTILGEILLAPGGFAEALSAGVCPETFAQPIHGAIFASLQRLKRDRGPVDEIGLFDLWQRDPESRQGHDLNELQQAIFEATAAGDGVFVEFKQHLAVLVDQWKRRRLVQTITRAASIAQEDPERAARDVEAVYRANQALATQSAFAGVETLDTVDAKVDELVQGVRSVSTFYPPLASWDDDFGPVERHELVVVAARPSVGKSSFMVQAAGETLARDSNAVVVIFTLEVDSENVLLQLAAQRAKCNRSRLQDEPAAKIKDLKHALTCFRGFIGKRLFIARATRLVEMEARLDQVQAKTGRVSWVGVDYLQLARVDQDRRQNRAEVVGEVSRTLKEWTSADRFACPVIALSQLNRAVEHDARAPRLSDLRESGAIEQDADRIIFVHRPGENEAGQDQATHSVQDYTLIQAKHRNGPTGVLPCRFSRTTTRFLPQTTK